MVSQGGAASFCRLFTRMRRQEPRFKLRTTHQGGPMRRLFLALAFLVSLATPARADVDLTLDAQSLTRLLSILAPPTVQVGMAPAASIEVAIQDIQVTGFDPAANGGLGHLLTKMRLVSPQIGLDLVVTPRVALDIRKK